MSDVIAYIVIYLFVSFVVLPAMIGGHGGYAEAIKIGFVIQMILAVFGVVLAAVVMAVIALTT